MSQPGIENQRPPIWALLVGVNEYAQPQIPRLSGCVPDVRAVDAFLREQLGVPDQQIRLLTDAQATYRAVIDGFEGFLATAPSGNQALVYFSCHGSQAPAVDPSIEPDGLDETLVLYDSRTPGVFDLLDKELGYLLSRVVQRGLNVTVILDACHSGSGTREINPEVRARLTAKDTRVRSVDQIHGGAEAMALARRQQSSQNWLSPGPGQASYVVISGCRPDQLSRELPTPDGPHGLLSYMLLEVLKQGLPETATFDDLFRVLRVRVRSRIPDQEPECEGDRTRQVFAAGRVPKPAPFAIKSVHQDVVVVEAGPAQGIGVGALLLAYPSFADRSQPDTALARLAVDRAGPGPSESRARVVAWLGPANQPKQLPEEALLVVESYGDLPVRNVFAEGSDRAALSSAIERAGSAATRYIALVERIEDAALIVRSHDQVFQIYDSRNDPVGAAVEIAAGDPQGQARAADQVLAKLRHLSRYWFARNLAPNPSQDQLSQQVKIELCRATPQGLVPIAENDLVVRTGDYLGLRLTNRSNRPLYISVWDFTPYWAVERILTENDNIALLAPNNPYEFEFPGPVTLLEGMSEGIDLLKAFIATEQTSAFMSLEMPPVDRDDGSQLRSIDPVDSLAQEEFFADLPAGTIGHRGLSSGGVAQWGVVGIEVKVLGDPQTQDLQPGRAVTLGDGVRVQTDAPIRATMRLVTADQATRGLPSEGELRPPPGLASAPELFEPLPLARARSTQSAGMVLAIDADQAALSSVSAQQPLEIVVPEELADHNDALLAVAFDGREYYLVGLPRASPQGAAVAVEWLPPPVADDQAASRDLVRTVRLLFYKVSNRAIPDVGLRHARLTSDGQVEYTPVQPASIPPGARVLLCIHGITADTGSMVRDIGASLAQELGYDQLLTFDYESFGTSVSYNAATLRAALHDAGIREEHGTQVDILAHSMGGLISRALVELEGGAGLIRRLVMAGTPNAGSPIASLARFGMALASLGLAAIPGGISKVAAWAVNWVKDQGSGLVDLQPASDLVQQLKNGRRPEAVRYYALVGTNLPTDPQAQRAAGLLNRMLDGALDTFFHETENDLVVAASSVLSVTPACDGVFKPACHHSGYFGAAAQAAYHDVLRTWLAR